MEQHFAEERGKVLNQARSAIGLSLQLDERVVLSLSSIWHLATHQHNLSALMRWVRRMGICVSPEAWAKLGQVVPSSGGVDPSRDEPLPLPTK